jgi:hypothetical protein
MVRAVGSTGPDRGGENLVSFLGLDWAHLAEIASRIAPSLEELISADAAADVPPRLVEHLGHRCGTFKPAERGLRLDALDRLLLPDLDRIRVR